jgi:hypothetical protein
VIGASCVECHSAKGPDAKARAVGLESWDQVKAYAFERRSERTPDKVKAISTHTHALSLGTMSVAIGLLAMLTCWPRWLVGGLMGITGLGLALDIASWWLASGDARWVTGVIVGGSAYNGATALTLVLVLLDSWRPRKG